MRKKRGRTQVYSNELTLVRALQTIKCKYLELDISLVQDKYIRAYSIKVPLIFDSQHICCLLDVFFIKQSAFLWVLSVLLFSQTCFFIHIRQTPFKGLWKKKTEEMLARSCIFTFFYKDDVLSLNISKFGNYIDIPFSLKKMDTTDTAMSVSYLSMHVEIDSEGRLRTKFYDKIKWFQFSHSESSLYLK